MGGFSSRGGFWMSRQGRVQHGAAGAPDGEEPLLKVEGLRMDFTARSGWLPGRREPVRAVNGVSFELFPGETLGLVGESGCGKSTTARAILRLVEPTEGSIHFRGADVLAMDERELRRFRRRAQIVFQDPFSSLNPRMRVREMLDEVLRVHGLRRGGEERRRRVGELLEMVGLLSEHADRYPHQFSGGQRQRIGIARALAVEPELLICDEPVSALDVSVQAQVVNLLVRLQEELGLTYLFIAHDLGVVEQVSDRVAVMYLGRIVEVGSCRELYSNPLHPYTRALLSAIPRPDPRGRDARSRILLEGEASRADGTTGGCPFYPRCWYPQKDPDCTAAVPALEEKGKGRPVACIKVATGQPDRS